MLTSFCAESHENLLKLWEFTVIEKDHLGDWSPEKDCC
mgnify:CR=1 FL=1